MVHIGDLPSAPPDPVRNPDRIVHYPTHTVAHNRRAQPLERRASSVIDTPGSHRAPFFAHPPDRFDAPRDRGPQFHGHPPDRWPGYGTGIYDPRDHLPPPFHGHPLDHREEVFTHTPSNVWLPLPPPPDRRVCYSIRTPQDVSAPALPSPLDLQASLVTSARLRQRSTSGHIQPHVSCQRQSPPIQSSNGQQYSDHHHRACDLSESSRSSCFHLPLKEPSSKRSQLKDGCKGSSSGDGKHESDHHYARAHGESSRSPSYSSGDGKHDFDTSYTALVNDFMDAVDNNWREPTDIDQAKNKEYYKRQTKQFAELALKRYNNAKNNKIKYRLVEAIDGNVLFEGSSFYAHVNFYANAKNGPKKNDPKSLVFAELLHVGRRPNAMVLTSFHLLDEKKQFLGCCDQERSSSHTDEDQDIHHCYACADKIKHPEGYYYKAGHFVMEAYYDQP